MSTPVVSVVKRKKKVYDHAAFVAMHEALGKPDFTPDPNPSIEDFLQTPGVPLIEKLDVLIKFQSLGNQSLFAVHDDDRTKPYIQADCARRLGVSRRAIHDAAETLVCRCRLRIQGQLLYSVPDPDALRRDKTVRPVANALPSLRVFRQTWFKDHSEILPERSVTGSAREQCDEAFKFIGSIKRQIESDFRMFRRHHMSAADAKSSDRDEPQGEQKSEAGADNNRAPERAASVPILIEEEKRILKNGAAAASSLVGPPPKATTSNLSKKAEATTDLIGEALRSVQRNFYEETGLPYLSVNLKIQSNLVRSCRSQAADCTAEEIAHFIYQKAHQATQNPAAFLLVAIPECFEGDFRAQLPPVLSKSLVIRKKETKGPDTKHLDDIIAEGDRDVD